MITRRYFLTRSATALTGAALLGAGLATPALADHRNTDVPQSHTREKARNGRSGGTPHGHRQNHGELGMRTEGTSVLGGTLRMGDNRRQHAGVRDGDCPNATGECPYGTGECDGSGPND